MIAIFPEIANAVASKDVERLAVLIRRYYGGPRESEPAPDMRALLGHVGVAVREHNMTDLGALLAKDEHGTFRITAVIAAAERTSGLETERFLLAHLLGHYLYDVQPLIAGGDWTVAGFREELCPARRYGTLRAVDMDPREDRADRFAAALLMPVGMARRAFEKLGEVARVAQVFKVPLGVAARRLEELSLLDASPANFLDAERRMERPGASSETPSSAGFERALADERTLVARTRKGSSLVGMERLKAAQKQMAAPAISGATSALLAAQPSTPRSGLVPEGGDGPKSLPQTPPLEGRAPPRSFAASTYRATERATRLPAQDDTPESEAAAPAAKTASSSLKGLERIREIARKLDKTRSE